ncbi:uncharacterized protein PHALS_07912 [Plasmopara halstedii]|uniref:Uncharacterized protein n=1 Tax=Plasmopara halstedii TaxID=4781 RepID=A0A0N7L8L2_PLAHL|nr:uncharacterized protein PHALS_07912 [Plasmopara halstedii]CEG50187.1 hypothetical protein PHALS_07912 [Plasmopara halstedii]|eukprot:XP_024586556.1 hypothetical protein PHALS_07912 [Plasmopara halstedii]
MSERLHKLDQLLLPHDRHLDRPRNLHGVIIFPKSNTDDQIGAKLEELFDARNFVRDKCAVLNRDGKGKL